MPDMGDLDFSKLGGGVGENTDKMDEDVSSDDDDMPDLTTTEEASHVTGSTTTEEGKGKEPAS